MNPDHIKTTDLPSHYVSTVRLPISDPFLVARYGGAFETMVFARDGETIDFSGLAQVRDTTEEAALATHERLCAEFRGKEAP